MDHPEQSDGDSSPPSSLPSLEQGTTTLLDSLPSIKHKKRKKNAYKPISKKTKLKQSVPSLTNVKSACIDSDNKPCLIIIAVLSIALISLSVFIALYIENNKNDKIKICTTKACINLAQEIVNSIDDTQDPCEDFFQFTCGNWIDSNDWRLVHSKHYSQFSALDQYLKEVMIPFYTHYCTSFF